MKVYVVTAGDYSYYHIEAVFTDPVKANLFAMLDCDRQVEKYDTEAVKVDTKHHLIKVSHYYEWGEQTKIEFKSKEIEPHFDGLCFEFTLSLSDDRLYRNIARYGKDCKLVRKIIQDKLAQYLYEHETTLDEIKKKYYDDLKARTHQYCMCTTSSHFEPPFDPTKVAKERMPELLKKYFEENGMYPDFITVTRLFNEQIEEAEKEHEQN